MFRFAFLCFALSLIYFKFAAFVQYSALNSPQLISTQLNWIEFQSSRWCFLSATQSQSLLPFTSVNSWRLQFFFIVKAPILSPRYFWHLILHNMLQCFNAFLQLLGIYWQVRERHISSIHFYSYLFDCVLSSAWRQ